MEEVSYGNYGNQNDLFKPWTDWLIRTIFKEGIVDEDHPEDDEEVDEPYDVERILEVKDNQEVSCSSLVYICDSNLRQSRN